ncbi:MAG: toxin-antitoxin system YwqK family antitoxin [Kofleriaceae bacterium]
MQRSTKVHAVTWWSPLVLVSLAGIASAGDVRPSTVTIPVPPGDFTPPPLPAGVHAEAPVDGWWKKKGACPKGTRLEHEKVADKRHRWTVYVCNGKGSPKPYTAWNEKDHEAWWTDADGERHGGVRVKSFAYETTELYIHGKRTGRWTHRALSGGQDGFAHYRDDKKHGLAHDAMPNLTEGGYYVDGKREGTWFVWNTTPVESVRAVFQYKAGVMDGTQRWWTRDGALLARADFTAGAGTWTAFGPDGARAETRCKGRELVEASARDRAGTLRFRACGPGATGCTSHGTKDGGERQTLGEMMCDWSHVPPFKRW